MSARSLIRRIAFLLRRVAPIHTGSAHPYRKRPSKPAVPIPTDSADPYRQRRSVPEASVRTGSADPYRQRQRPV